ncbi:hypothetical protein SUGI_0927370 [Cryptomeria japonica]|nr:hypothetical protein SUGI_0927370 [Cryptomeria japonica]
MQGNMCLKLAELIHDQNKISPKNLYINLKGFMVGNPKTHDANDWRGQMDYAWSHAVVSDKTDVAIVENCDFDSNNTLDNKNCSDAIDEVYDQSPPTCGIWERK